MRRRFILLFAALSLMAVSAVPVMAGNGNGNLTASLKGRSEVPANDSKAAGEAIFKLRGDSLSYKLIVANIDNVVASHIHCGAEGANGPVGVTLFSGPVTSKSGVLAQGAIPGPDAGNTCGWEDLDDVIAALHSGNTYVNVHTNPGIPSGEIRGQIG